VNISTGFILLALLLFNTCGEKTNNANNNDLARELDSLKALTADQAVLIDSLAAPSKEPIAEEPEKAPAGKAADLNYINLALIGQHVDRATTKKGLGKTSTGKEMQRAWEEGFASAGYSWAATLNKYASQGFATGERPAIAFLLTPYSKCKEEGTVKNVYSAQVTESIQEIEKMLAN